MAGKRKGRTSSLDDWTRRQIDQVLNGLSAHITLGHKPNSQLTKVPQEIRQLKGLRSLHLGSTNIREVPSWLKELPNLEKVDISDTPIMAPPTSFPDVLWGVRAEQLLGASNKLPSKQVFSLSIRDDTTIDAIQRVFGIGGYGALKLSALRIDRAVYTNDYGPEKAKPTSRVIEFIDSHLDEFLETQSGLRELFVAGIPLGRIPAPIRHMQSLAKLTLIGAWLSEVPDWLFTPELTSLALPLNDLFTLPDAINQAQNLSNLDLTLNQIRHVPANVWKLANLQVLALSDCPIEEIPADILLLERLSTLKIGSTFYDTANPWAPKELVVPPPEIAARGLDAIKRYWLQEQSAGVDYLAEAKLLIVGEPGAGKTSLAKKILDPDHVLDDAEISTEGIDVMTWQFPAGIRVHDEEGEHLLERFFRVNIWDFGGQEIYHSTHQFFLTKRSVYVLVTDERKEDTDFEYWLEIVNLLSDGSPLVIVQNRKQGRQHGIDLAAMRHQYPNLCGTLVLNLADNNGLDAAVSKIRRELEQLPHIGTSLPKTWRAVRLALEEDDRDYISAADFYALCQANGFTDRADMRQLGGYLHDLGICLFFLDDPLLSKTVILKPEWGTTAVYRILDDPDIAQALGTFTPVDLQRIWSDAAYELMRDELLQLMVKFQLCFKVPGSDTYIAPQLLTPSQPSYDWDESDNLTLRYEYDVMPKGIVRRLIVALHYQIASDELLWRSGAVFEYEGSKAEVIEMYRRRLLTIRIRGGDPRVLLGLIDHELANIHRSYPGIRFKKYMPCDCETCSASSDPTMFEIGDLEDFARTGDQIQCRRSRKLREPTELLRLLKADLLLQQHSGTLGVRRSAAVPKQEPPQPEIFISYSWGGDSETLVDEIQDRMAERGATITRDKNEITYRDSIRHFMQRLGSSKCVIVILSKAYLESKSCMYELTQIARQPEFSGRVYPIVMPDAEIFDATATLRYVKYWEAKRGELTEAMTQVGQEHLEGIREDLDLYVDIRNTIAGILKVLGDMNVLTPAMHRGTDFEQLYLQLASALQL